MSLKKTPLFYDTKTLAQCLDVTIAWLQINRRSQHPIPFKKIGRRFIRYERAEVLKWLGTEHLTLQFVSTKTLAKKLHVSVDWLKHNRRTAHPIPFKRLGRLVRYHLDDVAVFLREKSVKW